jgi:hypothetical protein
VPVGKMPARPKLIRSSAYQAEQSRCSDRPRLPSNLFRNRPQGFRSGVAGLAIAHAVVGPGEAADVALRSQCHRRILVRAAHRARQDNQPTAWSSSYMNIAAGPCSVATLNQVVGIRAVANERADIAAERGYQRFDLQQDVSHRALRLRLALAYHHWVCTCTAWSDFLASPGAMTR